MKHSLLLCFLMVSFGFGMSEAWGDSGSWSGVSGSWGPCDSCAQPPSSTSNSQGDTSVQQTPPPQSHGNDRLQQQIDQEIANESSQQPSPILQQTQRFDSQGDCNLRCSPETSTCVQGANGKYLCATKDQSNSAQLTQDTQPPQENPDTVTSNLNADCQTAIDNTKTKCDFDNSQSGITVRKVVEGLTVGTSNPAMLCNQMSQNVAAINALIYAWGQDCSSAQDDCQSKCARQTYKDAFKSAGLTFTGNEWASADTITQCNEIKQKTPAPNSQVFMGSILAQGMKNCNNLNANLGTAVAADPNNCNVPANFMNPTCVCFRDPTQCGMMKTGAGLAPLGGADGAVSGANSGAQSKSTINPPAGLFGNSPDIKAGNPNPSPGALALGAPGGRGGGMGGASDLSGGGKKPTGGVAGRDLKTNVYGGTYSGGGFGSSSRGGGSARSDNSTQTTNPSIFGKLGDLKKFLPNAFRPNRNIAGISGPDGITGPETNLFNKVRTRYVDLQGTLLP